VPPIVLLYIPHGSDESLKAVDSEGNPIYLYIPHGSDESLIAER